MYKCFIRSRCSIYVSFNSALFCPLFEGNTDKAVNKRNANGYTKNCYKPHSYINDTTSTYTMRLLIIVH